MLDEALQEKQVEYGLRLFDRILFQNGYWVSIQASEFHYCDPRETVSVDQYRSFELMVEVATEDIPNSWRKYDAYGVYANVPRNAVSRFLTDLMMKYGPYYRENEWIIDK